MVVAILTGSVYYLDVGSAAANKATVFPKPLPNATLAGQLNNTPFSVNVVYSNFKDAVPFWVAENQGYFKQANITVVGNYVQDSSLISLALLAGRADVGIAISSFSVFALDAKQPGSIKIFMFSSDAHNTDTYAVLVRTNSSYQSMSDLKGKKFGINSGLGATVMSHWITGLYFNSSNATYVTLPLTSMVSALAANQVDAVFAQSPNLNIATTDGVARELPNSTCADVINPFPATAFAFPAEFVREHPLEAQRIVQVMNRAVAYINSHPQNSATIAANYSDTPLGVMENVTGGPKTVWRQYLLPNSTFGNATMEQVFQHIADMFHEEGYINRSINVSNDMYVVGK
ncbi:NMT1/THI5 like protein [uncultured archaeon]|nr:NMT1/THI5 like protein [uncultured archaeon]